MMNPPSRSFSGVRRRRQSSNRDDGRKRVTRLTEQALRAGRTTPSTPSSRQASLSFASDHHHPQSPLPFPPSYPSSHSAHHARRHRVLRAVPGACASPLQPSRGRPSSGAGRASPSLPPGSPTRLSVDAEPSARGGRRTCALTRCPSLLQINGDKPIIVDFCACAGQPRPPSRGARADPAVPFLARPVSQGPLGKQPAAPSPPSPVSAADHRPL